MRRRGVGAVVLAIALVAVTAACGGGATPAGSAAIDNYRVTTAVTFLNVVPIESLTFTPEMIAEVTGLFERENLNVEFELTRGSALAIQNVLAGSGLLSRVGDGELMSAIGVRGVGITAVAQPSQSSTLRIVSLANDPVSKPADMRGRVIGIPSEGGASETLVDMLAAAGRVAEADLRKEVIGLGPGLVDLLRDGEVDAYVDSLDNAIALQQEQPDVVVLDPSESTSTGTQVYIASQRALADPAQRDAVQRYLRAINDAMRMVIDDSSLDRTLELLRSRYDIPILSQPEVAKQTLRDYIASWQANGVLLETVPDHWEQIYDESVRVGLVPDDRDPANWFTNDLLPGRVP